MRGGRVIVPVIASVLVGPGSTSARDPLRAAFEPVGEGAGGRYISRSAGTAVIVGASGMSFMLGPGKTAEVRWLDADPGALVVGDRQLPGRANYYIGARGSDWRTSVPRFAAVRVDEAGPGIDLLYYYRDDGQLEFDFEVAPGADPAAIRLAFADTDPIAADGGLRLGPGDQRIRIGRPQASQLGATIAARFVLDEACVARVELAPHDSDQPLVIDPIVHVSSYLGGTAFELSRGVGTDGAGNLYVVGETSSTDFPTLNPTQPTFAGGSWDLFVVKLDPTGSTLLFATYLGGSNAERDRSTFVDAAGNVYVAGDSSSDDFPTLSAYQPSHGGGLDGVVSKLSPTGTLLYSTYLGGSGSEVAYGISVDAAGRAYLAGSTSSTNFPTMSPFQSTFAGGANDAFVARLGPNGGSLSWSSFLGGAGDDNGRSIAVAADGTVFVTGETDSTDFPLFRPLQATNAGADDAFVAHIDPNRGPLYSTYLGGSGGDQSQNIVVDATGMATISGYTTSTDYPTVAPSQSGFAGGTHDVFISRLAADGASLRFSTFLGGSGRESAYGLAERVDGRLVVVGNTDSTDFPVVFPAQASYAGAGVSSLGDAFISEIDPAVPAVICSTYLGGRGDDQAHGLALDPSGYTVVSGRTGSDNFPLVAPFQAVYLDRTDVFFAKLGCVARPAGVGNSLRVVRGVTPGELVFTWTDVADAAAYRLYDGTDKRLTPSRWVGESASGGPGLRIGVPPEPLLYYQLKAANCCGESSP